MAFDASADGYQWNGLSGWKSYRTLRPFRGMYWDVRRRLPYYWSDIKDGWSYRTFAATIRIFFVNMLPALAFELDMARRTDGFFGVNEALFSSALAALVFSLFSCQPLTVVGITGLISLFNYTIYDIAQDQGIVNLYPEFLAWVAIWSAITHWMTAIFNWCDYMRYITDFSSDAFGMYVGIIYMVKGVEELVSLFDDSPGGVTAGYFGIVIALCYWASVYALELVGETTLFRPSIRKFIADFAYPICTLWWTGFSHIPGRIKDAGLSRLPRTKAFYPTIDRSWLIRFWDLPVKWVFVALPIGILLTLLFYYDHNVSSLTAQAKQYPLKKPAGFHWDFFLLGCTCFIAGIIGIPLPNGLVPQAPVHTDSCTEYVDRLHKTKEKDDDDDGSGNSKSHSWTLHNRKDIEAVKVHEQRISHFVMALGIIGLMTGPFLDVLHTIPRALFGGVFFVVGWGSIGGNGIMSNFLFILSERRFIDPGDPRLKLRKSRIAFYILFQAFGVVPSVAISQTIGAIGFPVIIMALIPLRWNIMPRVFSKEELLILDAPTADADVVLASMGGRPTLPEVQLDERRQGHKSDEEQGVSSSTSQDTHVSGMRSREGFKDEEENMIAGEKDRRDHANGVQPTLTTGHN